MTGKVTADLVKVMASYHQGMIEKVTCVLTACILGSMLGQRSVTSMEKLISWATVTVIIISSTKIIYIYINLHETLQKYTKADPSSDIVKCLDNSLTIRGTPAHVRWYSNHASTSVIVND